MSIFANSEDPDEMQHNVLFHQGLQWLLGHNRERITVHLFEIITCDPTVYPDFCLQSLQSLADVLKFHH